MMDGYFKTTKHPWVCLLFLIPLIVGYEYGVYSLGGDRPDALRNGADAWLRWGLAQQGFPQFWIAPLVVVLIFLALSMMQWSDRPKDSLATLFGMIIESTIFAGLLWAISVNFRPILERVGIELAINETPWYQSPKARLMVRYVGAGIYEEVIFRLGLLSLVYFLFRCALLPKMISLTLAAIAAALLFAAAHHVGQDGEPMVPIRFAFRALAGLYFAVLYITRGFGIAVGTHATYDILVGVSSAT